MKELKIANPAVENLPEDEALALMCKALGHPARIRIMRHLLAVDRCICGEIVSILPLAQSTVSQHLKLLKKAGLVKGEVEGPAICYCVDKERLGLFQEQIAALSRQQDFRG